MKEDLQSFIARVMILCHGVADANILTDIQLLQEKAKQLKEEAYGISKLYVQGR